MRNKNQYYNELSDKMVFFVKNVNFALEMAYIFCF